PGCRAPDRGRRVSHAQRGPQAGTRRADSRTRGLGEGRQEPVHVRSCARGTGEGGPARRDRASRRVGTTTTACWGEGRSPRPQTQAVVAEPHAVDARPSGPYATPS